jgi:hypothetical protein
VLALVPVAVNTAHWKQFIFGKARSVCFLADTRLKFLVNGNDGGKGAPMACCMVYWGTNHDRFCKIFSKYGAVIELQKQSQIHRDDGEMPKGRLLPEIPKSNGRHSGHETNRNEQAMLLDASSPEPMPKSKPVRYSISKRKK